MKKISKTLASFSCLSLTITPFVVVSCQSKKENTASEEDKVISEMKKIVEDLNLQNYHEARIALEGKITIFKNWDQDFKKIYIQKWNSGTLKDIFKLEFKETFDGKK